MDSDSDKNLQPVFAKLNGNESLFTNPPERTLKPAFIFSARNSEQYNYVGLSPVAGYNRYDGFMLGALIHNINLPANKFEFLFTPVYAFGSKTMEGLGRLSYSWHPENRFSKISIGINGGRFDTNKATDSTGKFLYENFSKLVPYIRVDFKPTDPRSSIHRWMDFKTFLITEKNYAVSSFAVSSTDSLNHPNGIVSNFYYVNQLSFNLEDNRALYPYDLRVEFQQSELFYRINLHADYLLNYPDGGGLQVRLFAAKFGVWKTGNEGYVARYEPKLLGVNGNEDYLYEDYFIGRSASTAYDKPSIPNDGLPAQQIMNRDGGLKLRIDAYDFVQGRSANWVTALNFNTTLPRAVLPFPVPLRIFFDIGTYAEAWENNPVTSRFLYTGGIQLSLFKNVLNIYAPIFYSSDFSDVLQGISFGKKITFSIDIQNINYKSSSENLPYMNESVADIRYLDRKEIETDKWDQCIREAANGLIYGRSFYLDTMSRNWSALVLNDYDAVMPLTWNRKFGISYLYQPPFTAQLGMFFKKNLDGNILENFIRHTKLHFRFCEIHLNFANSTIGGRLRANYILSLKNTYPEIRHGYKKETPGKSPGGRFPSIILYRNN